MLLWDLSVFLSKLWNIPSIYRFSWIDWLKDCKSMTIYRASIIHIIQKKNQRENTTEKEEARECSFRLAETPYCSPRKYIINMNCRGRFKKIHDYKASWERIIQVVEYFFSLKAISSHFERKHNTFDPQYFLLIANGNWLL